MHQGIKLQTQQPFFSPSSPPAQWTLEDRDMASLLKTVVVLVLVLLQQHQPLAAAGGADPGAPEDLQYRRHRRIRRRNAPQTPTAPVQPVRPPPPPLPLCNDTYGKEESLTASGDVCVPVPAPAPTQTPPVVPPPRGVLRCPPCTCPNPNPKPQPLPRRPFPGWPVPVPRRPVPARGGSNAGAGSDSGFNCVEQLAPMNTCGKYISANGTETPPPNGECCSGLAAFLRTSSAAAAAGRGDQLLQCLCPVILGDVNKTLQKPVDPVRMMYLPIACGVVLPPQLLYICFTGRPLPVVTNFPQGSEGSP